LSGNGGVMSKFVIKVVKWQEQQEEERNKRIMKFYRSGNYNMSAIGRMFKLSPQRVRVIIKKGKNESSN
jgi:hypothetical protein